MARVAVLAPTELSPDLRTRVGVTAETRPAQLGSLQVWARLPELASALLDVQAAIGRVSLPPRLLEMVRLRIAFHNQCRSCMALRSGQAQDDGLTEAIVCELQAPDEAPDLTDAERAALAYADRLSIAHHQVDDDLFDRLREHFSETQILELGAQVAFCIGFGRVAMSWSLVDDLPAGLQAPGTVGPWDSEGISRPGTTIEAPR
jgi:alkylhydroperoxidase family enzyme